MAPSAENSLHTYFGHPRGTPIHDTLYVDYRATKFAEEARVTDIIR
jgi:hypothetical protein